MKVKNSKLVWTCGLTLKKEKGCCGFLTLFPHAYLFIALVSLSVIHFQSRVTAERQVIADFFLFNLSVPTRNLLAKTRNNSSLNNSPIFNLNFLVKCNLNFLWAYYVY